jgi:hypothetical protein
MTAAAIAGPHQAGQQKRGRPFERGVSQKALFAQSRRQMVDEVIADLEAGGRKVSSADRLLVQRYVELIRSRSHSDTNTALKVWSALAAKYAGKGQAGMTAFDKYVLEMKDKAAPK